MKSLRWSSTDMVDYPDTDDKDIYLTVARPPLKDLVMAIWRLRSNNVYRKTRTQVAPEELQQVAADIYGVSAAVSC